MLPFSGLFRNVRWFDTDVSELHIGSIFKGQAFQEVTQSKVGWYRRFGTTYRFHLQGSSIPRCHHSLDCLTLEDVVPKRRYQITLRHVTTQKTEYFNNLLLVDVKTKPSGYSETSVIVYRLCAAGSKNRVFLSLTMKTEMSHMMTSFYQHMVLGPSV